jgi:ADP-L-glycero-D-manno-heptose 6-epimerase
MRWNGRIFWLLASGPAPAGRTFFPPSPLFCGGSRVGCATKVSQASRLPLQRLALGSRIQLQQRNCSRFARDFSRRSTLSSSQRTVPTSSRLRLAAQDLSNQANQIFTVSLSDSAPSYVVTGGAGFIGSNLTLALQEKFPHARLTVIDDFRSGDFKNLIGYRGDFVAQNLATLDWRDQFGDQTFGAIFHLASITDTTNHDQFEQVHDNVESFRRLLNFARPTKTRIIYASSASTYGPATDASVESNGAAPANIYAFSKVIMDNIAIREAGESPDWIIVGLRYFNVYGPREAHKGVPASMIYHLSKQIKAGQRPRIFKQGEQKRDFVYVKDVVEGSIRALHARESGIYNLGSGKARSFNELIDVLNKCLGTKFQPDYIDNPHAHYQNFTEADLTRVRDALGYEPRFSLERGVADYMKWLYPEDDAHA